MLNYIWLALIMLSVVLGGAMHHLDDVTKGAYDGARTAVMTVALPLVGTIAVWLGIMRLAERSGLVQALARGLRPVMRWLFPDVPGDHPAMGTMVMNIAANMLGLGNAATPLGLRAMGDLERLNPHPGTATNAMCTFLAINTSSVQLIPATAVAILAANGSKNPTAIVGTSLFATSCACLAGITAAKTLEKLSFFAAPAMEKAIDRGNPEATFASPPEAEANSIVPPVNPGGWAILAVFAGLSLWLFFSSVWNTSPAGAGEASSAANLFVRIVGAVSLVAVPLLLAFFPLYAALRGIKVYEEFVEGAREGFPVALRIIPFLVTMLVAIGMFRGSGGMDLLTKGLRPVLDRIGLPADLLPMVLMRPLSGSGTQGLFTDVVTHFGPDSLLTRMAGTIYGSTETTFYVVAVYFGAVAVKRTRHAIAAGLIADATGVIASVIVCRLMFGHG